MTNSTMRRKANRNLAALLKPTYFSRVPLTELFEAVEGAGVELEASEKPFILCGRDGRFTVPATNLNSSLVVTYHKMEETGRYEVVGYLS